MVYILNLLRPVSVINHVNRSMKTVTIFGCGLMGSGIAQVSAQSGYHVNLVDMEQSLLDKASVKLDNNLKRVATKKFANNTNDQQKFVSETMKLINFTTDGDESAKKSDLIIEAIVENIKIKQSLFERLDKLAPATCLFTSNTSSLPISEIAKSTKRLDKFGGLHFFNPASTMELVEVVVTDKMSGDTSDALLKFVKSIGKTGLRCKDTPGFIVNRLLVPYMCEAIRMLERGDASAEDIDKAMCIGAGYPMGPFVLSDFVGLDTTKFILDGWHSKFPDNPLFKPIPLLDKMVKENRLGKKSGKGFYDYSAKKAK